MTEDYKPTDNAIAERVNGILKTEVIYRERRFKTYQDALERISGFILFYNDTRPHYSIGMKTPSEVHTQSGPQKVMWKSAGRLSGAVCPPRRVNESSMKSYSQMKRSTFPVRSPLTREKRQQKQESRQPNQRDKSTKSV